MRQIRFLLGAALLAAVTAGCGRETPPPEEPTSEFEGSSPRLTVVSPVVELHERESDPPTPVGAGETMAIEPGANIVAREGGRAALIWPEFLTHDMLSGTDTLLSYSEPDIRGAMLDQASGTARYVLEGDGLPADVTVVAQWVELKLAEGEADMIVSLIPGVEPSAWLAVMAGSVAVARGDDTVTLEGGQAAAFTEAGDMPKVVDVDVSAIAAWYEETAAGTAEGTMASVALRCVVRRSGAKLRGAPDLQSEAVGSALRSGASVRVLQGHESPEWLYVSPITSLRAGWMATLDLACNGPVTDAASEGVEVARLATPTTTSSPPPRATAVPPPVAPLGSPTPSVTPVGEAVVRFWADDQDLDPGDCTYVRWEVYNIREVYLDGDGVPGGLQEEKVCPDETTTYILKVIHVDGSVEERSLVIEVEVPEKPAATNTVAPATAPVATQTASTLPTDAPPTGEPFGTAPTPGE